MEEEDSILRGMVEKIKSSKANVLCQKGIDDVAQHHLSKTGILAVRRIKESDMSKLAKATGGRIVGSVNDLTEKDLGGSATETANMILRIDKLLHHQKVVVQHQVCVKVKKWECENSD
jgi:chaperonin GroEL (HSP60 family)